jgi:hypothetical protein
MSKRNENGGLHLRVVRTGAMAEAVVKDGEDPLFADFGPLAGPERVSRRPPMRELFAQTPARVWLRLWRHRVGDAGWACAMELDHLILASRGKNPIAFYSRRLKEAGLVDHTRTRALRQLEKAGVIKVTPVRKGMSPIVTCLWRPLKD